MVYRAWMAAGVAAAVISEASTAWAQQGFALNRFSPAEADSEWFALDTLDLRSSARPALSLLGEVAHRPLATYNADGALRASVVENQAFLRLGGSLVLHDQVRLALNLPMAVYQNGTTDGAGSTTYAAPSRSAALGDIRFSADARLVGVGSDAFALAAGLQLFIPTGSRAQYTGDGTLRILARAMAAGEVGLFAYAAQVGLQHRTLSQDFGGGTIGSEAQLGCAFGFRLAEKRLLIGPELFGSTVISKPSAAFSKADTPVELLLGVHDRLPAGLRFGAGAGVGFSQGLGSPQARFIVSVGWQPEAAPGETRNSPARGEPRDPIGNLESPPHEHGEANQAVPDGPGEVPGSPGESIQFAPLDLAALEEDTGAEVTRSSPVAPQPRIDDSRIQRPKIEFSGPANEAERGKALPARKGLRLAGPKVRADHGAQERAVHGTALDPAVIAQTIAKSSKALQTCIETELRRHPDFTGGKILITATLKPSGLVAAATIHPPEIDGSTVGACLKEKARRIVFPAFEGEPIDVEVPLVLAAGE